MKDYSKDIVKEIKNSDSKFKHDNLTKNRCPECGKYMLEVKGKRGKMLVCEDRECNTRKTVSQITNSRCPVCHKKLELRGEGEAKHLYVLVDIEKNYQHIIRENKKIKIKHLKKT